METPLQTAQRLLVALEDFAEQETSLLRTLDFVDAVALQERAAPVVEKLAELAQHPEVQALQSRVAALIERRNQNRHFLDVQLARLQAELQRIDEARARLARVAPAYTGAYGNMRAAESRLNTAA